MNSYLETFDLQSNFSSYIVDTVLLLSDSEFASERVDMLADNFMSLT